MGVAAAARQADAIEDFPVQVDEGRIGFGFAGRILFRRRRAEDSGILDEIVLAVEIIEAGDIIEAVADLAGTAQLLAELVIFLPTNGEIKAGGREILLL